MSTFRDRFKDRNETVARDGSNSFAAPAAQGGPAAPGQRPARQRPAPADPAPQQQQPRQQHQQQAPPPDAQSAYTGYSQAAPPAMSGAQPSFFLTGGGLAAAPAGHGGYGASPYAVQQAPPARLPPLNHAPLATSYGQAGDPNAEYDAPPGDPALPPQPGPAGVPQQRVNRAFTRDVAGVSASFGGPESPTSGGRKSRRKEVLPDFHQLTVLDKDRRVQHDARGTRRGPVLIDHPVAGEYHQHNVVEYKRLLKDYKKQRWGGLGADDSDEKRAEREKRRKVHEYSKQVNAVNFAVLDQLMGDSWHNRPIERKPDPDAQLGLIKRQRARMYADAVKPPVTSARDKLAAKAKTPQPGAAPSHQSGAHDSSSNGLMDLEEKHRRDEEAIRRIKAQLNMVPS